MVRSGPCRRTNKARLSALTPTSSGDSNESAKSMISSSSASPFVQDLQASWVLLHYCAGPFANYLELWALPLRPDRRVSMMQPCSAASPRSLAVRMLRCLRRLRALRISLCALVGLACGPRAATETLRGPAACHMPSVLAAVQSTAFLRSDCVATWDKAMPIMPGPPDLRPRGDEPVDSLRGWQCAAAHACDERAFKTHLADLQPCQKQRVGGW